VRVPVLASSDFPPFGGIFVDPGTLPAVSDTAQNRFAGATGNSGSAG
jgi:hypothetical protein